MRKEGEINATIDNAANSIKAKDTTNALGSASNVADLLRSILDEAASSGKSASEVARGKGVPEPLVSTFSSQAERRPLPIQAVPVGTLAARERHRGVQLGPHHAQREGAGTRGRQGDPRPEEDRSSPTARPPSSRSSRR
ncbi:MAG: hypothetical protein LKE37_09125 [Atopobiaceae bacterium]|nr:hypothetical protein [Atopobiaceae bacterium]